MRYYYKDKNNNYYNFKTKGFQLPHEVTKLDDEGNEYIDIEYTLDPNYIEVTEEEFNKNTYIAEPVIDKANIAKELQIAELKSQLAATDFKAIKYAEGLYTEEEYAPIKAARQALRDEINELIG